MKITSPPAIARDIAVSRRLRERGLAVESSLDHVYFGANEVCTHEGAPYRVFTPYKRRWLDQRALAPRLPIPSQTAIQDKLMRAADIGAHRSGSRSTAIRLC